MCRVLKASKSGYFAWRDGRDSPRKAADRALTTQIASIHEQQRRVYGSPRVHRALRQQGTWVSRKRVERLMRVAGIRVTPPRRFTTTTDSNHDHPIAANLLQQDFSATAPNQKFGIRTGHPEGSIEPCRFIFNVRVSYDNETEAWSSASPSCTRTTLLGSPAWAGSSALAKRIQMLVNKASFELSSRVPCSRPWPALRRLPARAWSQRAKDCTTSTSAASRWPIMRPATKPRTACHHRHPAGCSRSQ